MIPGPRPRHRRIIAHHLVLTGYGHWFANDPRGSGSATLRDPRFAELGPIHHGRKPDHQQPDRQTLRTFMRAGEPLLTHEVLWFDVLCREAIAEAFAQVITQQGYTCYAAAVLGNHAHLLIRVHRDRHDAMWRRLTEGSRRLLTVRGLVPPHHPLWSERPYSRFCYTPGGVRARIPYIKANPVKEGLSPQRFSFVQPYDGWGG